MRISDWSSYVCSSDLVVREGRQVTGDRLVAALQPVEREHRGNRDDQADGGHDKRFADRTGDGVDRGLTRRADLHQREQNADHRTEQADERSHRTDGGEEGTALVQIGVDVELRGGEASVAPVVRIARVWSGKDVREGKR